MDGGMVSPSKYCTTPNTEYTVGNQQLIKDTIIFDEGKKPEYPIFPTVQRYKPLLSKKFFLDVRCRYENKKLVDYLTAYGAVIEDAYAKDIDYFVTDAKIKRLNSDGTLMVHPRPRFDPESFPFRTRSIAMLEKVASLNTVPTEQPTEWAQKNKIPVFTVPRFWSWIKRIRKSITAKVLERQKLTEGPCLYRFEVDQYNFPFIKIESLNGLNQPDFLPLHRWPTLHLNGPRGRSPFLNPDSTSTGSSPCTHTLTRKLSDSSDEVVVLDEDTVKEEEVDIEKKVIDIVKLEEAEKDIETGNQKVEENSIELREEELKGEIVKIKREAEQTTAKVESELKENTVNINAAEETNLKDTNCEKETHFPDKESNKDGKVISVHISVNSVKKEVDSTDKNFDDFVY